MGALATLLLAGCQSHEGGSGNEYNYNSGGETNNTAPNYATPATNHASEANMPATTNQAPENPAPSPAPNGGAPDRP